MKQVILASQSKQRRDLLAGLNIPFEVVAADLDELQIQDPDHRIRAAKVAQEKAKFISGRYPEAVIIAADTFIVIDDQRLEKPLSKEEGKRMLKMLSGNTAQVYTGWAYIDSLASLNYSGTAESTLTFRHLNLKEIQIYVADNPITSWAGSFSIAYPAGLALIASITGSLTGVLGLPIEEI